MNHHLKHVLLIMFGLLALVLVMQLASADAEAVTTYVWDGEGADALASTSDNWYQNIDGAITNNIAPLADGNIVFNGTSTKSCTWDLATNSFGMFTIAAEYSGTITQLSDIYVTEIQTYGGIFTGDGTHWLVISGNATLNKLTAGTWKIRTYNTISISSSLYHIELLGLDVQGNTTFNKRWRYYDNSYPFPTTDWFLNVDGELNGEYFDLHGKNSINKNYMHFTGNGTINSLIIISPYNNGFDIYFSDSLTIKSLQISIPSYTRTPHNKLISDMFVGDFNFINNDPDYQSIFDLNGHSLTASSITVGTRGILTNSAATDSLVTCSAFTQSGASSQVTGKVSLNVSGTLTISDGVFNQGADLWIGGFSQTGGTFTGDVTKWVYLNNGTFSVSAGTVTPDRTRLNVTGNSILANNIFIGLNFLYNNNDLNKQGTGTLNCYSFLNNGNITISVGLLGLRQYGIGSKILYNYGVIYSADKVFTTVHLDCRDIVDSSIINLGTIDAVIKITTYNADKTLKLYYDVNFAGVVIIGEGTTGHITLDPNGHSLTASSITVGTRGILANTHATTSTITATTFDSSNALGLFNGTNIILNMAGNGNLKTKATDIISNLSIPATTTLLSDLKVTNFLGITGSLVQGAYRVNITSSIAECLTITGEFSGSIYLDGAALSYRPTVQIPHGGTIYTNRQTTVIFTEGEFSVNPTGWVNITVLTWNVRNANEEASFHLGGTAGNCEVEMLITHDRYYNLWIDNSTSMMVGSPVNDIIAFDWETWSSHYFILNPIPMFMVFPDEFGVCFERYYFDTEVNENATLSAVFDSPDLRFDNASGVLQGRLIQNYPIITVSIRADDGTGGVAYLNFTIDVDMLYWNIRATINVYEYGSLKVGFNFTSTTPSDLITSVIWNFGDGTGSKGFEGVHEYKRDGYYWVTLIVKDINGNVGRESYYLKVGNPSPNNVEPPAQDDFGPLYDLVLKLVGIGALALVTVAVYEAIKRGRMSGNGSILLLILLFGMTVALFVSVIMGVL